METASIGVYVAAFLARCEVVRRPGQPEVDEPGVHGLLPYRDDPLRGQSQAPAGAARMSSYLCVWVVLAAGLCAVGACGCGGADSSKSSRSAGPAGVRVVATVSSVSCSESAKRGSSRTVGSCVFVVSDGRRFRCPSAFGIGPAPGVRVLEHATTCRPLTRLTIPASSRALFARIEKTRSCLTNHGGRVTGGPVLPPQGPNAPDGELLFVQDNAQTFIAFYDTSRTAQRLEPEIVQNARRLGGQVVRHGAVSVVWTRTPARQLRNSTERCAFG